MNIDFPDILETIRREMQPLIGEGRMPDYIPELARVSPARFGMAVHTIEGEVFTVGDASVNLSVQSISKLFTLTLAMQLVGDEIWTRMG